MQGGRENEGLSNLSSAFETRQAIPGPCEEELKFTLLQLQEKNKSLQLNILESPTIE